MRCDRSCRCSSQELDALLRYRTYPTQAAPAAPPKPSPCKDLHRHKHPELNTNPRITKMAQAQGAQPGQSSPSLDIKPSRIVLIPSRSRNHIPPHSPPPRTKNPTRCRTHSPLELVPIAAHRTIKVPRLSDVYFNGPHAIYRLEAASCPLDIFIVRTRETHGSRTCAGGCRHGLFRREGYR